MIQFPYGIADFRRIRREGMVYVDRTAYIRDLEKLGSILVFLRPRRFGKSLWIRTLATYYDLRYAESFDEIFGGLDIASAEPSPTPLANSYFVLQWNFSRISPRGGTDQIAESLRRHVRSRAELFLADYKDFLPGEARILPDDSASEILDTLLGAIRPTGRPLYLLIDEYDNFVNEVMVRDGSGVNEMVLKALFLAILFAGFRHSLRAQAGTPKDLGQERPGACRHGRNGAEGAAGSEESHCRSTRTGRALPHRSRAPVRDGVPRQGYAVVAVGLERLLGDEV